MKQKKATNIVLIAKNFLNFSQSDAKTRIRTHDDGLLNCCGLTPFAKNLCAKVKRKEAEDYKIMLIPMSNN